MIAEAAADDVAQVEVLELVVLEVCEAENEEVLANVEIATDPAADGVGGRGVEAVDGAVRVDGGGVDGDFVTVGDAGSFARERIGDGFGISAGEAEAGVQEATPEVGEVGVAETVGR